MSKNNQNWPCVQCNGRVMTHVAEPFHDKSGAGTWVKFLDMRAYRRVKKCIKAEHHHDYLPIFTYELHEADLKRIDEELTQLRAMREEIGRIIAVAGGPDLANGALRASASGR